MTPRFHPLSLSFLLLLGLPAAALAQSERPRLPEPSDPEAQRMQPARPTAAAIQKAWAGRPVLASTLPRMLTADDVKGWDVLASDGEKVGNVHDFVVDLGSGKIEYAIVTAGGVLGIGERRHAVPLAAIEVAEDRNAFTVPVDEERWEEAPRFDDDALASLAQERDTLRQFFQAKAEKAGEAESDRPQAGTQDLRLASDLKDAEIRNQDQTLGRVHAILLNLRDGDAFVRFGPDPSIVGTNDAYVLLFDQLESDTREEDRLVTTVTAEDFQRARPTFAEEPAAKAAE